MKRSIGVAGTAIERSWRPGVETPVPGRCAPDPWLEVALCGDIATMRALDGPIV
jgi:hypothetical protein